MKKVLTLLTAISMFLLVALPVSAQYDTPSTSTAILVDKLVGVPHSTKGGTTSTKAI
jgi:hypothetical protein